MDEIDYTDTIYDDFMNRIGDYDPEKKMIQKRSKVAPIIASMSDRGLTAIKSDVPLLDPSKISAPAGTEIGKKGLLSSGQSPDAGDYAEAAGGAMALYNMGSGGMYDTSAEGGGVGTAGSAIASGAVTGAATGFTIGGPWGAAIGGVIGGAVGGFSQKAASKKYARNRIMYNQAKNDVLKAEIDEAYYMEEGQESLGLLKGLRQKQLGVFNS